MANKRKPNKIHKLKGTFQPSRHGAHDDVEFSESTPEPPEILNGLALHEWNRVVPELGRLGLLTIFDRMILTQYCLLTEELFDFYGNVATDSDGNPKRPSASWHNQYKLIQQELGFTISSRASLKLPKAEGVKKSSALDGAM